MDLDYDPKAGWAPGAELEDLGELSGLLQGFGPIVQPAGLGLAEVQAMADAQLLDEARIDQERITAEKRLASNIPNAENLEKTNKFLENLYKSPALAQEDNTIVEGLVRELLRLIFMLEVKVNDLKLGEQYSYVYKYIVPGPDGQYGLDIREITHLNNAIESLNTVAALFIDDPDDLRRAAYHTANESFTLGDGIDVYQQEIKIRAKLFGGMVGNAADKIRNLAYNMTIAKINSVKDKLFGYSGKDAADATRFLVGHSLKITSYMYSMILGFEVLFSNIGELLYGTSFLTFDLLTILSNVTQTGLGLYGYLMNVLVTNPTPSAYSVLLVIFTVKRYRIGYGVVTQFLKKVEGIGHNLQEKLMNEDRVNYIMGLVRGGRSFMEDFDEFCTNALEILGGPVAITIQTFKELRFQGAERKIDSLLGLSLAEKNKILELLKAPDSTPSVAPSQDELDAIEDPLYVPALTVPSVIYERDFGGRFIFENHILSYPAPPEHAVRRVLPIGFPGMPHSSVSTIGGPYGFGKKKSKKVKGKKSKNKGSRKASRRR